CRCGPGPDRSLTVAALRLRSGHDLTVISPCRIGGIRPDRLGMTVRKMGTASLLQPRRGDPNQPRAMPWEHEPIPTTTGSGPRRGARPAVQAVRPGGAGLRGRGSAIESQGVALGWFG